MNFEDAKKYFLDALLEIHTAHTLMLARQGILSKAVASLLLEAIAKLDHTKILAARYDGRSEDLFFYIQHLLTQSCGEDVAGRIHTARSRNDIDLTVSQREFCVAESRQAPCVARLCRLHCKSAD